MRLLHTRLSLRLHFHDQGVIVSFSLSTYSKGDILIRVPPARPAETEREQKKHLMTPVRHEQD
jgi:hypothetical protein